MQPDTGAISLQMLAAALSIGALVIDVLDISERAFSHTNSVGLRYAEWHACRFRRSPGLRTHHPSCATGPALRL